MNREAELEGDANAALENVFDWQSHLRDDEIPPPNKQGPAGVSSAFSLLALSRGYAGAGGWHGHCGRVRLKPKTTLTYASTFKILRDRDPDVVCPPIRRALSCDLRERGVGGRHCAAANHSRRCFRPGSGYGPGTGRRASGGVVASLEPFERRATAIAYRTATMILDRRLECLRFRPRRSMEIS